MKEKENPFRLKVVSVRLKKDRQIMTNHRILSPEDAIKVVGDMLKDMDRENVCIINLRGDRVPINCSICSIGTVNGALSLPSEMLKCSILSNAASLIMVHNHPSADLTPSKEDIKITDRMIKVCSMVGIPLLDHVIVGGNNDDYYSIREKSFISFVPYLPYESDINRLEFDRVAERGQSDEGQIYSR